jgi:hypothetical protein
MAASKIHLNLIFSKILFPNFVSSQEWLMPLTPTKASNRNLDSPSISSSMPNSRRVGESTGRQMESVVGLAFYLVSTYSIDFLNGTR